MNDFDEFIDTEEAIFNFQIRKYDIEKFHETHLKTNNTLISYKNSINKTISKAYVGNEDDDSSEEKKNSILTFLFKDETTLYVKDSIFSYQDGYLIRISHIKDFDYFYNGTKNTIDNISYFINYIHNIDISNFLKKESITFIKFHKKCTNDNKGDYNTTNDTIHIATINKFIEIIPISNVSHKTKAQKDKIDFYLEYK